MTPANGGGAPPGGEPAPTPVLRAEDVVVRYGGETVVRVGELELREGELLVLLGPNGAGKSSLMRVLAMLESPASGRVTYRGREGAGAAEALRARSTAVFQRPHLWSGTVADSLRRGLRLSGASRRTARERVGSVAAALELEPILERRVEELSAGQAQRVALARALGPEPEILFLDEPTASLDAEARDVIRGDVERVARRGGRSTLLITHDRREAFRLADRIAVLEDGRLVRSGTPQELYERPGSRYVARVSGAELGFAGRVRERVEGAGGASSDDVRLLRVEAAGALLLAVGGARPGDRVTVAYRPEDLALAPAEDAAGHAPAGGTPPDSVRNEFAATVREVRSVRGLVRVALRGPPDVVAVVTRGSAEALELRPGTRIRVRAKATALHAFPR